MEAAIFSKCTKYVEEFRTVVNIYKLEAPPTIIEWNVISAHMIPHVNNRNYKAKKKQGKTKAFSLQI